MLKKGTMLFLALLMCLSITACGSSGEADTLRIYGLCLDYKVDPYLKAYKEKVPELYISIESGVDINSGQMGENTGSEALKKLNAKLLAGEGPDIILLDDMNAETYIEAGLLEDITDLVMENEHLINSVVESSRFAEDGKIYAMPAAISLMADTARTGTEIDFTSAQAFSKSLKQQGLQNSLSYDNEAALWYRKTIDPLLQKEKGISREKLEEFFTALQSLEDYEADDAPWKAYFMQTNLSVNPLKNYQGIVHGQTSSKLEDAHKVDATLDYVQHVKNLQELYHYRNTGALTMDFWEQDGGYCYIPMLRLAINKNAKNKEAAKDFVRFLLSEEGQKLAREHQFLPVSEKVTLDEMNLKEPDTFYTGNLDDPLIEEISAFSDETIDEVKTIFANLNQPLTADSNLMEIVMHGAMANINGEVSLDTALDNTMNKLEIYLAE